MGITDGEKAEDALLNREEVIKDEDIEEIDKKIDNIYMWVDERKNKLINDEEYNELKEKLIDLGIDEADIEELIGNDRAGFQRSNLRNWAMRGEEILKYTKIDYLENEAGFSKWTAEFIAEENKDRAKRMLDSLLRKIESAARKVLEDYFGKEGAEEATEKIRERIGRELPGKELSEENLERRRGKVRDRVKDKDKDTDLDEGTIREIVNGLLIAIFRGRLDLDNAETVTKEIIRDILPEVRKPRRPDVWPRPGEDEYGDEYGGFIPEEQSVKTQPIRVETLGSTGEYLRKIEEENRERIKQLLLEKQRAPER